MGKTLGRYNKKSQDQIHERTCNATMWNQRTGKPSAALLDKLTRTLFDTNLVMHTSAVVRADQDWIEGDLFVVTRPEYPGKQSSIREVKFIETREDGISIKEMVILGTIDL
jgi:hypothetical protein